MTSSSDFSVLPWIRTSVRRYDHDRKLLFRGMWEHRFTLLERFPNLILPSVEPELQTHAAALILVWVRWDQASGSCPDCDGLTLAQSFGGILSVGVVAGVCTGCGLLSSRRVGGMSDVLRGREIALTGTPFVLALSPTRWRFDFRGIPADIVAALRWCGVSDLPKPRHGGNAQLRDGASWKFTSR